jgi:phthiodiolone/phenolphthiodiolone dimycocerosates ketoreductase
MRVTLGAPGRIMPPASKAIEFAQQAEADGFDTIWWPWHLMGWMPDAVWNEDFTELSTFQSNPHLFFDPLIMMGAAGAATDRIRVGVCVTDTIHRHPAMLAQESLTVDHLARGRSILGLGSGERMNVTPYGLEWEKPVGRLEEAIKVLRLLWEADGPVNFEGKFFRLENAVIGLDPYEGRTPPIWLAAHGPRMLRITGRLADGWLPTNMPPETYAEKLGAIRDSAEAAGRDPDAITPSMLAYVICAPDEETLAKMYEAPLARLLFAAVDLSPEMYERHGSSSPFEGGTGFHSFMPTTVTREECERIISHIPGGIVRELTLSGTPARIAEQIRMYAEAGLRDVVLWNITPFADASQSIYSFKAMKTVRELLETEPAPAG